VQLGVETPDPVAGIAPELRPKVRDCWVCVFYWPERIRFSWRTRCWKYASCTAP
jgi:hypothetical protein